MGESGRILYAYHRLATKKKNPAGRTLPGLVDLASGLLSASGVHHVREPFIRLTRRKNFRSFGNVLLAAWAVTHAIRNLERVLTRHPRITPSGAVETSACCDHFRP